MGTPFEPRDMTSIEAPEAPRVLLVSDNRDNPNWGSRSTTMALIELLTSSGLAPTARFMDSEVRRLVPVATTGAVDSLLKNKRVVRLVSLAMARGPRASSVTSNLIGVADSVSDDPVRSVANWIDHPRPPFDGWLKRVEESDVVVINGEGSMIFTPRARREQRFHLALMELARQRGIPYLYVNALASDPPSGERNEGMRRESIRLLEGAHAVTARDPESLRYFHTMSSDIAATYIPDAVFSWYERLRDPSSAVMLAATEYLKPFVDLPDKLGHWDFSAPYLCVGGSSEAAKDPARARATYTTLIRRLSQLGLPLYVTASCLGDAFLEDIARDLELPLIPATTNVWAAASILANAAVVVTGRYHPAILAGLGGTHAVMLGADSHKAVSVQEMLGYPEPKAFSVFPDANEVNTIASRVEAALADRHESHARLGDAVIKLAEASRQLGPTLRRALTPEVP